MGIDKLPITVLLSMLDHSHNVGCIAPHPLKGAGSRQGGGVVRVSVIDNGQMLLITDPTPNPSPTMGGVPLVHVLQYKCDLTTKDVQSGVQD